MLSNPMAVTRQLSHPSDELLGTDENVNSAVRFIDVAEKTFG